jgi:FtsP/CotA-like multicopper oxidase with cupredoxin domain
MLMETFTGPGWVSRLPISGHMFSNMPMPSMKRGNVVTINGHRTDIFSLLPAEFVTADMVPDSVGMWMFHCHVDEHMEADMTAMYEVMP